MREAIIDFWPRDVEITLEMTGCDNAERLCLKVQLALGSGAEEPSSTADGRDSEFRRIANALHQVFKDLQRDESLGKVIAGVFEAVAEPHLIQPTIIYDFPLAVSPLSKKKPNEPDWVARFEFYIGGFDVGNAFSHLNDPADQLAPLYQQM